MKYSVFAISALVAAVAAQPAFLNSAWDLEEGKPFEIKYSGCEGGCTIILQTGEPNKLVDVTTLTATADGSSFTWTPSDLPSGTYSFKIYNNDDKNDPNYSSRFEYSGTGTLSVSASTASATSATGSASASSAAVSSSAVSTSAASSSAASSVASSGTTTTPVVSSHSLSRNATIITTLTTASSKPAEITTTKKSEEPAKTTAAATTSATTVPNSGATRVGSSLALVAGAIMAMVYLN